MLVDFTTALSMFTSEASEEILHLVKNHKGHYMLDICSFLTKGHRRTEGHEHVKVASMTSGPAETSEVQVLEFHVTEFDMTVSDEHLTSEMPADCVLDLSHAESVIEQSCERLRRLRRLARETSSMAAHPAQMCQDQPVTLPSPTTPSSTTLLDGGDCPSALQPRCRQRDDRGPGIRAKTAPKAKAKIGTLELVARTGPATASTSPGQLSRTSIDSGSTARCAT